jgi:hypothetical protein
MPQGGPPGMPMGPGMQGMRPPPDQAKTMIAQPSPFGPGGMPQQGMPQQGMPQHGMPQQGMPQQGPGGYSPASPAQKTIMAMSPNLGGMMPPGQQPGYPPMQQMPPGGAPQSGANKTVMLRDTEGLVSVARTGQPIQPIGGGAVQQGASTLFWIVSLVIGVAVGALAYVIVLQV